MTLSSNLDGRMVTKDKRDKILKKTGRNFKNPNKFKKINVKKKIIEQ